MLLAITLPGITQESECLKTLKDAKQHYEQGLIDQIPSMLAGCMESGFTRAQKIEAYKLIILAYLFDDDQYEAEKTMDEFLKKFPEYEVMPSDPVEFVYLLESYKTASVYSINFFLGPTFTNPRIIETYTPLDVYHTTFGDKTGAGYQIGIGATRNIWKSFFLELDVIYSTHKYTFTQNCTQLVNDLEIPFISTSATERLTELNFPLTLCYKFGKGNLNYFFRFGGTFDLVNKVTLSPSSRTSSQEPVSESNINDKNARRHYNYGPVLGGGLEYKIPRGYLVLDARYQMGIGNLVLENQRYNNPKLISRYKYEDSNFNLNNVSINFGYYFSIYQSKKSKL